MKVLSEADFASPEAIAKRLELVPPELKAQAMADYRERFPDESDEDVAFLDWASTCASVDNIVLEKNDATRLHKLKEAILEGRLRAASDEQRDPRLDKGVLGLAHSFVVQHDWYAAFASAADFNEGDVRLPYDSCAFEFRMNGRTVMAVNVSSPDGDFFGGFIQSGDGWRCGGTEIYYVFVYVRKQVRAICIALDAEIATREIIRAPSKLNAARVKAGKLPLVDYHVVALDGRHKKSDFDGGGTHRSPRLHFRRGHWRHFDSHKSWIRWTLVGNHDLGYIDKHYKLP